VAFSGISLQMETQSKLNECLAWVQLRSQTSSHS
jgi:hypothetical protein